MRTFERTHCWIAFHIDLGRAPANLWLLLGEAASKIEHLGNVPLLPETRLKLHQVYLAKGVSATTAIEGNTLSEEQVLRAVRDELEVPPSQEYLKREVDNVIGAVNSILTETASGGATGITPEVIRADNRRVLEGLPRVEENGIPGEVRQHGVIVGSVYRGAPAEDCTYLLGRLCEWLNGPAFKAPKGRETVYAILQAVIAHLYLAWIHPFGDGNGRTARLAEIRLLLAAGVPAPAAHLLSNHYNQTRAEYYRQLDRASKSGGDVIPFIEYAVQGLVDGLRQQLGFVWQQQWGVFWANHVYGLFRGRTTPATSRLQQLALGLADKGWVDFAELAVLTPGLAALYAAKTPKTLARDIAHLRGLGLIEREGRLVRARREIILSTLPFRRPPGA